MEQLEKQIQLELATNPLLTIQQASTLFTIKRKTAQFLIKKYSTLTSKEKLILRNKINFTLPKLEISQKAHQIILGSLLGDGCVTMKRHGMFTILHSTVQKQYVEYKKYLLDKYNLPCYLRFLLILLIT